MIRLARPSIDEADLAAVRAAVESGQLVQGRHVVEFENAVARAVGARHAVAVTNCTAALHMALLALGVGPGDIVLVAAYSWPATANAVELCGAQAVFVDIDPRTFNMRPDALESVLTRLTGPLGTRARVKAILPVHTFGQICDMPALDALARHFGVPIVEDAACALGASVDGRAAGHWGVMGCFSFHPRKAVTTGEGGVITTDDDALNRRLRALRNHGLDPEASAPEFILPGFNNRMTEFQAALGVVQMTKLERVVSARRALAVQYDRLLDPSLERLPANAEDERHVYQSYIVLLPESFSASQTRFIEGMRARGIEAQIGTWHIPLITYYRSRYGFHPGDFPVCDAIAARAVSLPLYEGLEPAQQREVAEACSEMLDVLAEVPSPHAAHV